MTTATQQPETTHYLCIGCPMGCRLEVDDVDGEVVEVRGNSCRRGDAYGRQEHVAPTRMVTTTVRVENGRWARLPVKTRDAIPKELMGDLCDALHTLTLQAPISMGDVVLPNALDTGVDVVASRDMPVEGNRE
ncbi:MAG: DUF1667 domain-containing protein [Phormidium sp. GEM2.Bin31]|nr:DUF1667 domain-containing protein [Phormidium sp. BM_Day4_Bin.17]TVR11415.1 MAG: DUF1667 domain-containing protein [Phormidium sp. GEM2.Bin31]UCJ10985.1 MAG: DUF1667 domain-containing protein [Phormidium sp. PBR-2020]